MKVTNIGNVYQLTLWPKLFPVNCYIFEEENELTLIDTGMPASYKGIVKTIAEIGKPLTNIVLTHAHGDHVGSLDQLKETFKDVVVSVSNRDSRLLKGDKSLNTDEPQLPIKGGVPKKGIKTNPDRLLKEGDTIGSLKVFETPGHTPGSISLFDTKSRAIIVGDAFQTRGKLAVCGQIVKSFPFPAFGTWSKEISLRSAKKIFELKPSLLAVGHGEMIKNPNEVIKKAILEAKSV
ncbi:glyoxylase-like metal-dependent hydrolase (beta-lactamase superfamily II) [Ureibacillus xyleni]|uniref:Glyoxylase-like metal-dependent hydrolase (Beta-lactamase superfamily II) n=1 Tax=Ureibacillus xyleni TaxID=614648 RepID=A0A285RZN0_9BACL|nr:MBL fold metallo-hydrolase [Ureibacillus xyleni]SOB99685.1 glyoxylase-like metal-dependent hydrolase (beta-lactamase superfamily II) [Ureibacillus xyleni]